MPFAVACHTLRVRLDVQGPFPSDKERQQRSRCAATEVRHRIPERSCRVDVRTQRGSFSFFCESLSIGGGVRIAPEALASAGRSGGVRTAHTRPREVTLCAFPSRCDDAQPKLRVCLRVALLRGPRELQVLRIPTRARSFQDHCDAHSRVTPREMV